MNERSKLLQLITEILNRLNGWEWAPILLARVSVGVLFFESGRGKLFFKFEELVKYFGELGIPLPYLNALFVASVEFVGGALLVVGVLTRLVSAQLAVIMVVAVLTAQIEKAKTVGDFLYLPEVLLIVIFVWFIFSGAGKASIDHYFAKKYGVSRD